MTKPLEIGRWYAFRGAPVSQRDRPVRVIRVQGDTVLGKWASGMERLLTRDEIGEQVEDAVPGATEPCCVCGGAESVPLSETGEDEPSWSGRRVGTEPCPNCRSLD